MKRRREFEWMGDTTGFAGVSKSQLSWVELPVAGSPGQIGGAMTGNPYVGAGVVDALFHRVLLDVNYTPLYDGSPSTPLTGAPAAYLQMGLLMTEYAADDVNASVLSPAEDELDLDGEWLWRYNFPLFNLVPATVQMSAAYPQVPLRHDIGVRGGRGSRATEKRRIYAFVLTLCNDAPDGSACDVYLRYSLLYSSAK